MIPTSIDGTDITGATVDGTDVTEITVDGQTVFTSGPDIPLPSSAIAQYDATQITGLTDGDPITSWADSSGNGNDVTGGSPTYKTNELNGQPVVRFDGNDDTLDVSFSNENSPNTCFFVCEGTSQSGNGVVFDRAGISANGHAFFTNVSTNSWGVFGTNFFEGGTNTYQDYYIFTVMFDGSNSFIRQDGSQVVAGDVGTAVLDGIKLGQDRQNNPNHFEGDMAEVLVCNTRLSTSEISNQETRLSNKWGIAI